MGLFRKWEISLIFILTFPMLSFLCVCVCMCVCVHVCMCVICLFIPFLSVLFLKSKGIVDLCKEKF